MSDLLFYLLATALVIFSLLAVHVPNLLHAAIALIASFFVTAAIYIMLEMEFLALAQIMLYIGGIVIFMLIIILLTTGIGEERRLPVTISRRLAGAGLAALFLGGLIVAFGRWTPPAPAGTNPAVSLDAIGLRLLATQNGFVVAFELISVLLLTALVGAVVIARKDKGETP
ncbi:MAG: hypothetical protein A2505_07425 [Deltaproteobacteria bacterium RIFOXYD12_FULL_55_16]|nr:MAG: hypothetical protein A2505_07425 [Deltaproteobacteria bacterium RIFOXYD12_FULL_55_16]